jgi:hypothetical protein
VSSFFPLSYSSAWRVVWPFCYERSHADAMKIITAIYLIIAIINLGFWLNNGLEHEILLTAYSCLTWSLYFFSLLSLLAFSIGKRILPGVLWRVIFTVYLLTRLYELVTRGLVPTGGNPGANLNIISSYLWLVFPAGLAMWYLGFRFVSAESLQQQSPPLSQPGSGTEIAHLR